MVVWGHSFGDLDPAWGPDMFNASNVLTNEDDIWVDYPNNPSTANYWITDNDKTGKFARLFMSFCCTKSIKGFRIKNTHNGEAQNAGTENFSILTSESQDGPWIPILSGKFSDPRNVDPVPVERFPLTNPIETRFLAFQVDSFYGPHSSGGLQYLAVY